MIQTPTHDGIPQASGQFLFLVPHKHADTVTNTLPRWHESLEVKLFYTSGTTLIIGDEVFLAHAGDVFVIDPYVTHSTWDEDLTNDYHMLDIDLARIPATPESTASLTLEALNAGQIHFLPCISGDCVLKERIEALVTAYSSGTDSLATLGETYLLLDALIERASCRVTPPASGNPVILARKLSPAMAMLQQRFSEPLTLQQLADACGLHPRYFCKLFREKNGTTVISYLHRLRVSHACVLLKATDLTVDEIAFRCGFADREYFSRIFRRLKNCTPLQYRKRLSI